MEHLSEYAHSPVHSAVLKRDYTTLKHIVSTLPRFAKAGEVNNEEESLNAEKDADAVSAVIDRRDVPGRETPLHLAVKLRDSISAEILMSAGADWSLQNDNGWSALQEAVCTREEKIAMIITRYYQPLAWAKWCRKLPRIIASTKRIRDFYMEITFHFESSVIPFIGRIAPSDTYRIWKRGSNLRADMTMAGFDGFRIQRSDKTFLFLGEGYSSADGKVSLSPGSLIFLAHKEKEIVNALENAGVQPSDAEVAHEVVLMSQTNMYRPGIDVTQAELVPRSSWRRQEIKETVGTWKAKVYDMLHVLVSVKSRRVPGAMTDEELFSVNDDKMANESEHDDYDDVLTAEERLQLDSALRRGDGFGDEEEFDTHKHENLVAFEICESNGVNNEKKNWFGRNKKGSKYIGDESHRSLSKSSRVDVADLKKSKDKSNKKKKKGPSTESKTESEYKKGLCPVLWLTPDFPLKTEELLPLLDILANKVKAIRRLRELLTTKLPPGTFPVKIAVPIVPTVRVLVTFTKFEELQPMEEFSTPVSSPEFHDAKSDGAESSTSWISWMRGSQGAQTSGSERQSFQEEVDPFLIPSDYAWVDASDYAWVDVNEKNRRMKAKKTQTKKNRTSGTRNTENGSFCSYQNSPVLFKKTQDGG